MQVGAANGWTLVADRHFVAAYLELEARATAEYEREIVGKNSKLLAAVLRLVHEHIPSDPTDAKFRLGDALGPRFRSWCRAKFHQRYRLFFRYNSNFKVVVYSWFNSQDNLRKAGSKNDPYSVFCQMLQAGKPPTDFGELLSYSAKESL